jgi:hypothetical protein
MRASALGAAIMGSIGGYLVTSFITALLHASIKFMLWAWVPTAVLLGFRFYEWQCSKVQDDNDRNYRPKKAAWDRSIMCMRCGSITEQVAPG